MASRATKAVERDRERQRDITRAFHGAVWLTRGRLMAQKYKSDARSRHAILKLRQIRITADLLIAELVAASQNSQTATLCTFPPASIAYNTTHSSTASPPSHTRPVEGT